MDLFETILPYLAGLTGLLLGGLATWLTYRGRVASERVRAEERGKAAEKAIVDLEAGSANLEAEVQQMRHTERALLKRQGELEVLVASQHKELTEKQHLLEHAKTHMARSFQSLSQEVLKSSQEQFLHVAKAAFEDQRRVATSELEQRRIAVETLVKPVAQSLDKVQGRIEDLEMARENAYSNLREQVSEMTSAQRGLRKETSQLIKALRQPVARGDWGGMQLQRVVELAGMQEHCDFVLPGDDDDQEGQRAGMLVKLPGGKQIVIDSQAPMDAYLEAVECEDESARAEHLRGHAERVAGHMRELASPDYREQFSPRPEFVVLFLPNEAFFSAALIHDTSLIEKGVDEGVLLATPTTLIALLKAIATGWHQEDLAENARRISEAGRDLFSRLTGVAEHFARLGDSLESTVQKYNHTIGSFDCDVLPSARKLDVLGANPGRTSLPEFTQISLAPRRPRLTELGASNRDRNGIEALAATGEVSGEDFEGFEAPEGEEPEGFEAEAEPSANGAHPDEAPDPEKAADDLRAALTGEE